MGTIRVTFELPLELLEDVLLQHRRAGDNVEQVLNRVLQESVSYKIGVENF
jgi:hypothetical protein